MAPPSPCVALPSHVPPPHTHTHRRAEETRKERKGRKRNLALLSFGEQAEEEEQDLMAKGAATNIKCDGVGGND
jgi:hypothetical protein